MIMDPTYKSSIAPAGGAIRGSGDVEAAFLADFDVGDLKNFDAVLSGEEDLEGQELRDAVGGVVATAQVKPSSHEGCFTDFGRRDSHLTSNSLSSANLSDSLGEDIDIVLTGNKSVVSADDLTAQSLADLVVDASDNGSLMDTAETADATAISTSNSVSTSGSGVPLFHASAYRTHGKRGYANDDDIGVGNQPPPAASYSPGMKPILMDHSKPVQQPRLPSAFRRHSIHGTASVTFAPAPPPTPPAVPSVGPFGPVPVSALPHAANAPGPHPFALDRTLVDVPPFDPGFSSAPHAPNMHPPYGRRRVARSSSMPMASNYVMEQQQQKIAFPENHAGMDFVGSGIRPPQKEQQQPYGSGEEVPAAVSGTSSPAHLDDHIMAAVKTQVPQTAQVLSNTVFSYANKSIPPAEISPGVPGIPTQFATQPVMGPSQFSCLTNNSSIGSLGADVSGTPDSTLMAGFAPYPQSPMPGPTHDGVLPLHDHRNDSVGRQMAKRRAVSMPMVSNYVINGVGNSGLGSMAAAFPLPGESSPQVQLPPGAESQFGGDFQQILAQHHLQQQQQIALGELSQGLLLVQPQAEVAQALPAELKQHLQAQPDPPAPMLLDTDQMKATQSPPAGIDAVHAAHSHNVPNASQSPSALSDNYDAVAPSFHNLDLKDPDQPDLLEPHVFMSKLKHIMSRSEETMLQLQEYDKANGLPKSHSSTMVKSARSRKQLQQGIILKKWDGSPLIHFERTRDGKVIAKSGPKERRNSTVGNKKEDKKPAKGEEKGKEKKKMERRASC